MLKTNFTYESYRLKRLTISPLLLVKLFTQGNDLTNVRVDRGAPSGAILEGIHTDPGGRGIVLVVSHPDFEEIPDGGIIPELDCQLTRITEVSLAGISV